MRSLIAKRIEKLKAARPSPETVCVFKHFGETVEQAIALRGKPGANNVVFCWMEPTDR